MNDLKEALRSIFLTFNHPKYHKFCDEWCEGALRNKAFNVEYFLKEYCYLKDNNLLRH
jgi:hypothetical protein